MAKLTTKQRKAIPNIFSIPLISQGQRIPLGLSKYREGMRLRFPIFIAKRRGYDACFDGMAFGLWRFDICIKTELSGIAVHWGWNLIKEYHGETYREAA